MLSKEDLKIKEQSAVFVEYLKLALGISDKVEDLERVLCVLIANKRTELNVLGEWCYSPFSSLFKRLN
ncbi:hypothetical protein [Mesobacillus boroniphilus]|uniref:Uncharacterized protein n=1 Tax=Mesobacillus boroniphilus JCM 21738 TaxID=1294265 RepID=W4RQ21_9BACI|nr:hypothetical protein [Mesobacillus boroniphilus]GAE46222.1 hypothetical protein JCM21738_3104 [Mesobacillus boroniphilus JCM 21738]